MENKAIDVAVNVLGIVNYLYLKDIIAINPSMKPEHSYILISEELFREMFPGVEANEDGEGVAEYKGVKIVAVLH